MSSTLITLSNAVCSEILAGVSSFSVAFTPTVKMMPGFELQDLSTLRVTVVPRSMEITNETRGLVKKECIIDIGVQKKISDIETDTAALLTLSEQIIDYMRNRPLSGYSDARWIKTENDPIYSQEHLFSKRVFSGLITLTYRVNQ
jgi:hypothetical protein